MGTAISSFFASDSRRRRSPAELQDLIQSVVIGYINELQGIENDLLVQIQSADLSDSELAHFETGAMLRTDEAFRKEYALSLEEVEPVVQHDVMIQAGREAVTWVGANIATNITISLATALAERLGVSAGILGTGSRPWSRYRALVSPPALSWTRCWTGY